MRILYITDAFIYPLTSGYLRHYHFIKRLASDHEIYLLSIVDSSFKQAYRTAVESITTEIYTFERPSKRTFWQLQFKRLRKLVKMDKTIEDMHHVIQNLMKAHDFDVVLLAGQETYQAVKHIDSIPIVADLCDASSKRIEKQMRYASFKQRLWLRLKALRVQHTEQTIIEDVASVLFASQRDAIIVGSKQREKIAIVPNGVDLDYWQRSTQQLGQRTIIFTGAMNYPPNEDAAIFLINEIVPIIRQSIPDLNVFIVGHSPSEKLQMLGEQANINITGFVEDMRPYLEQATLFVAPLRFGSGIQNKVLESMAMELPIIASPLAVNGLSFEGGQMPPLMVASEAEDFAGQITQFLLDNDKNTEPNPVLRQFVARHFSWEQHGKTLSTLLEQLAHSK